MKKLFSIAVVAATIVLASCGGGTTKQVVASSTGGGINSKEVLTGPEGKVKEWKEQGFQISGALSTFTMYDVLKMHNEKILSDTERYSSEFGASDGPDKSTARLGALMDASINYATRAGSVVSGGMGRQFSNFGEMGNKLMGAYTQKVKEYVTPFLKESCAVCRPIIKNGKNLYEYEVFYILDEQKAKDVRKTAMDAALKETGTEQVFGTAVDEWVKKFVANE